MLYDESWSKTVSWMRTLAMWSAYSHKTFGLRKKTWKAKLQWYGINDEVHMHQDVKNSILQRRRRRSNQLMDCRIHRSALFERSENSSLIKGDIGKCHDSHRFVVFG